MNTKKINWEDIVQLDDFKNWTKEQAEELAETLTTICDIALEIAMEKEDEVLTEKTMHYERPDFI